MIPRFYKVANLDFKRGHESIQDAERFGRPKSTTIEEVVQKVLKGIMNDSPLKLMDVDEIDGVLNLNSYLGNEKVVSKILIMFADSEPKNAALDNIGRVFLSLQLLVVCYGGRVLMDSPLYVKDKQTKQWTGREEPTLKRAKSFSSAGEFLGAVFFEIFKASSW